MDDIEATTVEQIMTTGVVWVGGDAELRELAGVLADAHVAAVAVRLAGGDVGVVSERDVVRAIADGAPPATSAAELASLPLVTAEVDDRVVDVVHRMLGNDVRHVVVIDRETVVGMVSVRDLLPLLLR